MNKNLTACFVFLCRFLNWTPIFHVSCDDRYGSYAVNTTARFSLLVLSIGMYKIYFLTYAKGKISPCFVLGFRSVVAYPSTQIVDQKAETYCLEMKNTNRPEEDLKVQYEFLKEGYNNACASKSSMLSKVSSHASTYLVLAGFYAYVFNELWKLDGWQKTSAAIFISVGVLFLITAGVFAFSFLQVSSEIRSRFSDVKAPDGSSYLAQAKHAYINWYASKLENTVLASKIKNIELNMVVALLLVVALWGFVFVSGDKQKKAEGAKFAADLEIQILNSEGVLDKEGLSKFFDVISGSRERSLDQYVVLSSNSADAEIYSGLIGVARSVVGSDHVSELRLSSSSGLKSSIIIKVKKGSVK